MSDEIPNDATNAGEDKKKAEAITIRVKDQVRSSLSMSHSCVCYMMKLHTQAHVCNARDTMFLTCQRVCSRARRRFSR